MIANFIRKIVPAQFRPIGYLLHLTRERTRSQVHSGPFTGLRYVEDSVGSAYIPKLLGIYESELAAQVDDICQRKPELIIDVGAAEGYYAVGLAIRNPQAHVIAFEMEAPGQAAVREMASLNQVSQQIEVRGKCEPADLSGAIGDTARPIIVCDVEGYEEKLLDPETVPALARAVILVELHDFIIPGITETLMGRFKATHHIEHVWQQPRSRTQFPWRTLRTSLLPTSYLDWSVSEWRPVRMAWLWMVPHD